MLSAAVYNSRCMNPATNTATKRLYFKSYLQFIRNSVGSQAYRNLYIQGADGSEQDAMDDGSNSCAFFVSSVLTIFKQHSGIHGTVKSTVLELSHQSSGWQRVDGEPIAGDVVIWKAMYVDNGWYQHIGFCIGKDWAVSTSWTEKQVVEHDLYFDGKREIEMVFRNGHWDQLVEN
jgi:hypothetical protein